MSDFSFYHLSTGAFARGCYSGPEQFLAANTPEGFAPISGRFDHLCRRVEFLPDDFGDATVPVVVSYQPPVPADDDMQTWTWSESVERWVSVPTTAARARDVRAERDRRMAAADWVTLRAVRTGKTISAEWAAYLQALADVPDQAGFPSVVEWPVAPA